MKLVARRAPIAGEGLFRFLVRVPVTERGGVAFDPQRPHLPVGQRLPFSIDDPRFVTVDDASKTARLDVAGPVRDVDVKHLRRAYAVAVFNAERVHPAFVKLYRQRLARRITETQTRKIVGSRPAR